MKKNSTTTDHRWMGLFFRTYQSVGFRGTLVFLTQLAIFVMVSFCVFSPKPLGLGPQREPGTIQEVLLKITSVSVSWKVGKKHLSCFLPRNFPKRKGRCFLAFFFLLLFWNVLFLGWGILKVFCKMKDSTIR